MSDENQAVAGAAEQAKPETRFIIQRIYVKDVSFEAPNSPSSFTQEWNPKTDLDLSSNVNVMGDNNYEVELALTITVRTGEQVAFLVEVKQAGIFTISGYSQDQLNHVLAAYCPNTLFPYAREVIAGMVSKGSFPEMHLSPINFDALYANRLKEQRAAEQQQSAGGNSDPVSVGDNNSVA